MATYATQADFEAYVEGWTTSDPAALERLLERAERDVDSAVGRWDRQDNGLKFGTPATDNEQGLTDLQKDALARATCAQAEYRLAMGEAFFVEAQPENVSGPDYSQTGALPRIGPKVYDELEGTDLMRLTTRLSGRGSRPGWHSFSYNVD